MSDCFLSDLVSIEKLPQPYRVFNSALKGRFQGFRKNVASKYFYFIATCQVMSKI